MLVVGWLAGWLAGLLAGLLAGWLAGWLAAWLAGWLTRLISKKQFKLLKLIFRHQQKYSQGTFSRVRGPGRSHSQKKIPGHFFLWRGDRWSLKMYQCLWFSQTSILSLTQGNIPRVFFCGWEGCAPPPQKCSKSRFQFLKTHNSTFESVTFDDI